MRFLKGSLVCVGFEPSRGYSESSLEGTRARYADMKWGQCVGRGKGKLKHAVYVMVDGKLTQFSDDDLAYMQRMASR